MDAGTEVAHSTKCTSADAEGERPVKSRHLDLSPDENLVAEAAAENEEQPRGITGKLKKKKDRMASTVARETGPVLLTLDPNDLQPAPSPVTWNQEEIKLLCSYNWQGANDGTNTIFVPGGPPKYIPNKPVPCTLEEDAGFQAVDYNYVRKPFEPFAPLFTALGVMNPDYQFWDVDVLADRNNLRVLLEFVSGKANGPLRLDVHMVQNTLIIARKGERFWRRQSGSIGNTFEKNFTRAGEGMEDATSHYRAIRYPMGQLNVVVRFEADAYYEEGASDELEPTELDAVTGALLAERPHFDFKPPIRPLQKGQIIPTAQMAELKTVTYKEDKTRLVDCQDQLWFGRTTHLFTGIYSMEDGQGKVHRIKYENAKERVDRWEEKHQDSLRKLVDLLLRIRSALMQQAGPIRVGVLVRESRDGPLVLRTMLRKPHIVGRDFFMAHWTPTSNPRFSSTRGGRGQYRGGSAYHSRPPPGMSGYYTHPPSMGSGNYGGSNHSSHQGYGYEQPGAQQQPGGFGGYNSRPHGRCRQRGGFGGYNGHPRGGYGHPNAQQHHGGYGGPYGQPRTNHTQPSAQHQQGNYGQSQTGYGQSSTQQQPGAPRGEWSGGRGAGSQRGHNDGRGRGRGRGSGLN